MLQRRRFEVYITDQISGVYDAAEETLYVSADELFSYTSSFVVSNSVILRKRAKRR